MSNEECQFSCKLQGDGVNPPDELENLDLVPCVRQLMLTPMYKEQEYTWHSISEERCVSCLSGSIPGTTELTGWPDTASPFEDWRIILMPSRAGGFYPLRFFGDLRQCLQDLTLLKLQL